MSGKSENNRAVGVQFAEGRLIVDLSNGSTVSAPVEDFPRLRDASAEQRKNWRLIGGGVGIHWPDVDEDISVEGLLAAARPALVGHVGLAEPYMFLFGHVRTANTSPIGMTWTQKEPMQPVTLSKDPSSFNREATLGTE